MDNNVKKFYEEEAQYEKSIVETKKLVEQIIKVDIESLNKKIKKIDSNNEFEDFIGLLNTVIGKKTNEYYYCKDMNDFKYYGLEPGKVYKVSTLNPELQTRNSKREVLNLQARAILAPILMEMSKKLKDLFTINYHEGDGVISTIDNDIIVKKDLDYLDKLVDYLNILIDQTGRLKILVAERDVYALENAKEEYNKKSSIEKWFYKAFNKEESVIENMSKKR